jgi:hypothetical protein
MTRKDAIFQYFLALAFFFLLSGWINSPGYMDAEYYTLSARQLAGGKGLTQPILWNYLDDPESIPHASHTYWMPGPSLVASTGMILSGRTDFTAGRVPLILLAALAAPAAGWMGNRFGRNRLSAWLAAGMALFCGYYAVYSATVDSFFLVMLGAWVILACLDRIIMPSGNRASPFWMIAGLAAGWMHLNRADGLLWLGLIVIVWFILSLKNRSAQGQAVRWMDVVLVFLGYLLVTGFWYYRNITELHSLLSPNSSRALWVTTYDELFSFPPQILTFEHWISSGIGVIIQDRLGALSSNMLALFGVQGMVFLIPFWVAGLWKLRNDRLVQIGFSMEVVMLLVMSFVFPYSGKQGGYLHSSAALQPFFWGLSAAGFSYVIEWVSGKRKWEPQRAVKLFAPGLVMICGLATYFIFQILVIDENPTYPVWDESLRRSTSAKELIDRNGIPASERIMINNPAGFSLVSGREALVIPYGDPEATLAAANKFDTEYLILEKNIVSGLHPLYLHPADFPEFSLIDKQEDQLLFHIVQATGTSQ